MEQIEDHSAHSEEFRISLTRQQMDSTNHPHEHLYWELSERINKALVTVISAGVAGSEYHQTPVA